MQRSPPTRQEPRRHVQRVRRIRRNAHVQADNHRKIKDMCKEHANVRDGADTSGSDGSKAWTVSKSEPGVSWGFIFQTTPQDKQTTCPFDCETVFLAFADNTDCKYPCTCVTFMRRIMLIPSRCQGWRPPEEWRDQNRLWCCLLQCLQARELGSYGVHRNHCYMTLAK
jgi:hypothetical protein